MTFSLRPSEIIQSQLDHSLRGYKTLQHELLVPVLIKWVKATEVMLETYIIKVAVLKSYRSVADIPDPTVEVSCLTDQGRDILGGRCIKVGASQGRVL